MAITAQSAQDCLQKVYTAGMNAYSVKPCNPDNLRAICTQMGFINDNWAQGDLDGEEDIDDDWIHYYIFFLYVPKMFL